MLKFLAAFSLKRLYWGHLDSKLGKRGTVPSISDVYLQRHFQALKVLSIAHAPQFSKTCQKTSQQMALMLVSVRLPVYKVKV